jgi:putative ABC transport system permease protein
MIFRRRREESDLDREILDYIERETNDNIASGMSPADARHAAMCKFGRPVLNVKEDTRAVWGWIWLESLWQDLRHGIRMLAKNPGFTFVAVLSLAIGIGANSAMFSFADALLLRPMPVLHPTEVVTVGTTESVGGFTSLVASYRDYLDFRDQSQSFDGLVAISNATFGFATTPGELPQMKWGSLVTGNFFRVMGMQPELGRDFLPEEDRVPGRDAVLILDHDTWQNQFAGDPSILGRHVRLDGIEFTIVGVAPSRFTGIDPYLRSALYVPIAMWPRLAGNPQDRPLEARDFRKLTVKGRLKPGVSVAQARAEVAAIAQNLERAYPETNRNRIATARTELENRIQQSPPDAQLVAMLGLLAMAVLIVACANVAGLLTSRAPVRAREIALRLAIGAGRPRLIRQLLTESLLIAIAGGLLGLLVGYGGVVFFRQIKIPTDLPLKIDIDLDQRALLFSLAVAVVSALLFGLAPAIQTTRTNLASALKSATAVAPGRRRLWGRNLLVSAQVAISLVLLTVSTTLFRGFHEELRQDPGFRTDHLLTMTFDPTLVHYNELQTQQFFRDLVDRARAVPGVKSAALASFVPFNPELNGVSIAPEGYQFPKDKDSVDVFASTVGDHYFETAGIHIVRGRAFYTTDNATSPRVAVVNEELAKRYWPGKDPVGQRFRIDGRSGPWVNVVGVAKTIKYLWIAEAPTEFLYLPLAQHPQKAMTLLAESSGAPLSLVAPLREAVRALDTNQPIYNVRSYEDYYHHRAVSVPNLIIETVGAMGVMGVALAMAGLYGLVAYAAGRRTREIGIRMAIGAHRGSVLRMVMRQGLVLSLAGLGAGLVASLGVEQLLNAMFAGSGTDIFVYLLVAAALLAITMFAAYIPARRASHVDPTTALRYE